MKGVDRDTEIRIAALELVRRVSQRLDRIPSRVLNEEFVFEGQRIPLVNQQRDIFKPRPMARLLSIRTVFPRRGARVCYDDQRKAQQKL